MSLQISSETLIQRSVPVATYIKQVCTFIHATAATFKNHSILYQHKMTTEKGMTCQITFTVQWCTWNEPGCLIPWSCIMRYWKDCIWPLSLGPTGEAEAKNHNGGSYYYL